jgi:ATP-dependent RNA helicase RhlE
MHFSELALNKLILKAVFEKNYETPTEVQRKTIPLVLEGKDVIASAQTGTGKTGAFALPILQKLFADHEALKKTRRIRALVVSPTRELAVQIESEFQLYGKYCDLKSACVFGGTSIDQQKVILKKGVDILIATPGRLLDLRKQDIVNLDKVQVLVLDEADMMLDMGFVDDVQKIERMCPESKQTLLFSATMPNKVIQLARTILIDPERVEVMSHTSEVQSVNQSLYYVPKSSKIELCLYLLRNELKGNILIFRRTKNGVDKLEQSLLKNDFKVESLHGDKTQSARQKALNKFKNGEVTILLATDVASRGIDINDLDVVVNFDLPNIPETYVHRIGRTGRAGKTGMSLSFCAADEKNYVSAIQKLIKNAIPVVGDHPYPLDPKATPQIHRKKGSKHKKGRKSAASKKNKKRWY